MLQRLLILLTLLMLAACTTQPSPLLSPPTPDSTLPAFASPTALPSTPLPTDLPLTATVTPSQPAVTPFPNADDFTWTLIASGLVRPVDLQADGSGRLFVIEKPGRIRIIENGQLIDEPFLNIEDRVNDSSNEMGLLGLAFHPHYAQNGYFFVNYTGSGGDTFISRFQVSSDPNRADPSSEVNLLRIKQPFPNHNGGTLQFGPDGYLYAGLGDGGLAGDPFGNAQSLRTLLGKILRIDVDSAEPYAVPPDNPFGDEIWAYGLRNPWRMAFDPLTGDLYIADVGQDTWEEINYLPAGSPGGVNFGWDYREGAHPFEGEAPAGLTDPIVEYNHAEGGCSVTGGYVYRGAMPEWNGIYLYGDYCTGFIWGLVRLDGAWQTKVLFDTDVNITSFGQDKNGEVYLVADGGGVYQLVRK
ncbi:MAG: PQQ-dependent sugar dehydrogenase [Chloroflexota bacterium]|nr:PQQ-dependent sugar dehydrogenase [Chloroflexota bacterium]MBI5704827.1 PQQ-dependent sugar dehydrogenase [Chloroflexota bacterium]